MPSAMRGAPYCLSISVISRASISRRIAKSGDAAADGGCLLQSVIHSPPEFRVNGVVRNLDAWYDAFGVREEYKLYLPPRQRVTIW